MPVFSPLPPLTTSFTPPFAARAFATLALLWTVACAGGADSTTGTNNGGNTGGTPTRLDLSTSTVSLGAIGASEQISATVRNASGGAISGASVNWSSEDITVADVAGAGTTAVITARAPGRTTVRAQVGSFAQDIAVQVLAVRGLTVTPTTGNLRAGDQLTLVATLDAEQGAVPDVRWSSENPGVAIVSSGGVVTAVMPGSAVIRATAVADARVSATALLTIQSARSVRIVGAPTTLRIGDQASLGSSIDIDSTQSREVLWSSSQPSIASISSTGVITALATGTTTLRLSSVAEPRLQDSVRLEVRTARTVTVSPATATLGAGETRMLSAQVVMDAGMSPAVTWRSDDPAIAMVAQNGLVTGVARGRTTITAIAVADTMRRGAAVIDIAPVVRDLDLSPSAVSLFTEDTRQLTATVSGDAGTSRAVLWRSSNAAVASVSATGLITANAAGTAIITALAEADTTRRATALVTVRDVPVVSVSVVPSSATVGIGQTVQLTPSVVTQGAPSSAVSFRSSNPAVASVNFTGLVTGLGVGNATITVLSSVDTTKRATAAITISAAPPPPTQLASSWSSTRLGGALYEDVVAIDAVDASTIFAVNSLGNVYRYNGSTWSLSAAGSTYNTHFVSVSATSASHAVAVGTNGAIIRFNGAAWSSMTSGTTQTLFGVSLESSTAGFAVGAGGTALRYNGASWTATSTGTNAALSGVWSAQGVAIAVGTGGTVLRYNGSVWSAQTSSTTEMLYSVSGTSANNLVAVGAFGTVLRYDGAQWTQVPTGDQVSDLYGVAASSANGGQMLIASDDGVLRLQGSTLSPLSTPYAPRLFALDVDGDGNIVVGGQRGIVMRTTSASWETLNAAPDLIDVWTASATASWAVGEFGFIYRWNGSTWTRQPAPTTSTLNTVWGNSASEAFAGGDNGTMLRWNGSTWSAMSFPGTGSVYGLWGSSANSVYAVTSTGQVLRYNGSAWSVVTSTASALWSVFGTSATDVHVSGEQGVVMRFNGTTWSSTNTPVSGTIAGVWAGSAGSNVVAVGANPDGTTGLAYRASSGGWIAMSPGTSAVLTSVWGPNDNDLYATGGAGTILRYNGTSWSSMSSGTSELLWAVTGPSSGAGGVFAVGYNSTLSTGLGTGGSALLAAVRTQRVRSLEPARGARTARGALPTGKLRQARKGR